MHEGDLISVIVPVYNSEQYVRETLESLIKQTYENIEILVVDDGSTDQSPAICDEFLVDDRVRVFHRSNYGLSPSRQFGIDRCNGNYFVTVDSDDYVSEDYIEKLYTAIKKNDADISVCGVSCFAGENPKITAVYLPVLSDDKLALTKELLNTDFYKISCDLILTDSWNKMYRTAFVKNTNVKFELEKIYNGTDLQFNHRLALHCPVYCVCRESLLFHRNHEGSRISRKDKPLQAGFEIIMESLINECKIVGISIRNQLSVVYYGLIGMVALDIFNYGGSVGRKHKRYQTMVSRNKCFLKKHLDDFDRNGLKSFYVLRYTLPSFMLGNALWLDIFFICYSALRRVKHWLKRKK